MSISIVMQVEYCHGLNLIICKTKGLLSDSCPGVGAKYKI